MSRNFRGSIPLCDRLLCTGLFLARHAGRLSDKASSLLRLGTEDFFSTEEMRQYRLTDKQAIARAIEQTLTMRVSFYSVQRRWELPIEEAGRFGMLRRLYCSCILSRLDFVQ